MIDSSTVTGISLSPALLLVESDIRRFSGNLHAWQSAGVIPRVTRGNKMRTLQALFDEFAAAWQFPYYFGENQDAFNECIGDLDWLAPNSGYVVVVPHADEVLADDTPAALAWLVKSLTTAARLWAVPEDTGEAGSRPPFAFHVVLHATPGRGAIAESRWRSAGADIERVAD